MTDMGSHDYIDDELAGFEDVIALIESAAELPTPPIQAAHIQAAAAEAQEAVVRRLPFRRQSGRPARLLLGRVAAATASVVFGVSGLAAAGVLPDRAQNAVAGVADIVGISLPTAATVNDRPLDSSPASGEATDEGEVTPTPRDTPSGAAVDDEADSCSIAEDQAVQSSGSASDDRDDDEYQAEVCADDETDEGSEDGAAGDDDEGGEGDDDEGGEGDDGEGGEGDDGDEVEDDEDGGDQEDDGDGGGDDD